MKIKVRLVGSAWGSSQGEIEEVEIAQIRRPGGSDYSILYGDLRIEPAEPESTGSILAAVGGKPRKIEIEF